MILVAHLINQCFCGSFDQYTFVEEKQAPASKPAYGNRMWNWDAHISFQNSQTTLCNGVGDNRNTSTNVYEASEIILKMSLTSQRHHARMVSWYCVDVRASAIYTSLSTKVVHDNVASQIELITCCSASVFGCLPVLSAFIPNYAIILVCRLGCARKETPRPRLVAAGKNGQGESVSVNEVVAWPISSWWSINKTLSLYLQVLIIIGSDGQL